MRHGRILSILALVVAIAGLERRVAGACPTSCLRLPGPTDFCTPAAQFDTTLADVVCCRCYEYRTAFDVPEGTLYASSSSSWDGCEAIVTLEDDFVVAGLPDGTPVSFIAQFSLVLQASSLMGPGFASASITEGVANTVAINWDNAFYAYPGERDTVLTIPVSAVTGTPFRMKYFVRAYAGELTSAEWRGAFTFANLPSGGSITSCKGYNQKPVPAQTASWGRVKSVYR